MINVLFVCNFEAPYRIDFWNELTKYCNVTVLFSESIQEQCKKESRDERWFKNKQYKFHFKKLRRNKLFGNIYVCFEVKDFLMKSYDIIVFHPYSPLTCIYGIIHCIKHDIPYIINSDGGFAKDGRGIIERFKRYLISHAEGWLSTGDATDSYLKFYGAASENLYRYCLTSVLQKDILKIHYSRQEKIVLRKKLGINEQNVIISVGRHIPTKGFDTLLKAALNFNNVIGIYIVGGTPPDKVFNFCKKSNLINIHFLEFMEKDRLKEYYLAADLFVLPTQKDTWGLVVNESFANGIPVITTNKCIAGLELVKESENGNIFEVDDANELTDLVNNYFSSKQIQEKYQLNAIKYIQNCSIETMAHRHYEIFKQVLDKREKNNESFTC